MLLQFSFRCRIIGSIHSPKIRYFLRRIPAFFAKMIHAQPVSDSKKPLADFVVILEGVDFGMSADKDLLNNIIHSPFILDRNRHESFQTVMVLVENRIKIE